MSNFPNFVINVACVGLYMVAQERQLQNRQRMLAESLNDVESGGTGENV